MVWLSITSAQSWGQPGQLPGALLLSAGDWEGHGLHLFFLGGCAQRAMLAHLL